VNTRVHIGNGEIRLSWVQRGTERPYLVVPVDRVHAAMGEDPGAVALQIDDAALTIALADRRTRRRFLSALDR
jgi:hypothetical protein